MKKAIIYRRASTNNTKQANSLDNQARDIYLFAEHNNYSVVGDFAEYQSASKGSDRPAFRDALSRLRDDAELTLICYDLTRLSRDLGSWNEIAPILHRIRFTTRGDSQITELEASILLAVSANESRVLSRRISNGIKKAKQRAQENNEEWKWGGNDDPKEARKARAEKTRLWRSSIVEICSTLSHQGLKTYKSKADWLNKNGFRSQSGNLISVPTLRNALISK